MEIKIISTHAPAGGATWHTEPESAGRDSFLLTPLREGRLQQQFTLQESYIFLLTPLREGRRARNSAATGTRHFYSRPCGRGDNSYVYIFGGPEEFLLTPLREGRR